MNSPHKIKKMSTQGAMINARMYKAQTKETSREILSNPSEMIIGNKAGMLTAGQNQSSASSAAAVPHQIRPLPLPLPINTQMSVIQRRQNINTAFTGAAKSTNRDIANNNSLSTLTVNNPLSDNKLQMLSRQNARQQANLLQSKSTLSNSSPSKGGKIVESSACAPLFSKPQDSVSNPLFILKTSPSKLHVKDGNAAAIKRPPSQYLQSNSVSPSKIKKNQNSVDFSYFPEMNINQQQQQQDVSSVNFFSITSTADEPAVTFSEASINGQKQILKSHINNNVDSNRQLEYPPHFQVLPSKRNTQITPLNGQEISRAAQNMMIEKTLSSQSLQQQNQTSNSALTTTAAGQDTKKATFIGANSNIVQHDTASPSKKGFIIKPQHSEQYPKIGFQEYENQTCKVGIAPQMKSSITSQMLSANNRLATLKKEQLKSINIAQSSLENAYHHNSTHSGGNNDSQASPIITLSNGRNTTFNYRVAQNINNGEQQQAPQLQFSTMSYDDLTGGIVQTMNSPKEGASTVISSQYIQQPAGNASQILSLQQHKNYPGEFMSEDLTSRISQQSYQQIGLLSSTLKQSVLIMKNDPKSNSEQHKKKDITSPLQLVPNNDAVHKQTQLYKQLQEHNKIQQQVRNGQNKNKRIVLAANSSHFRHSSNTIKKQLLAQAAASNNGGYIQSPGKLMAPANLLQNELKKTVEFNYKVVPSISYETQNINNISKFAINTNGGTIESPEKSLLISQNNNQIASAGSVAGQKFGQFQAKTAKGIDEFNKELQSIIEKEKMLTEEIIRNSLVKPNGRFNFEALAHLNDIMESKKNIKKRFAGEISVANQIIQQQNSGDPIMVIQSYSGQKGGNIIEEEGEGAIQEFSANSDRLSLIDQQIIGTTIKTRASDSFLKKHYGIQKAVGINSPTSGQSIVQAFQDMNPTTNKPGTSSLSGSTAPKPQQQVKSKKKPRAGTSQGKNSCKITIYHKEDHSMKHIQEHPINKAIQKINYLVRLIFKGMNVSVDPQKQGNQMTSQKSVGDIQPHMILFSTADVAQQQQQMHQQTALQQHQNEEQRLQEIQRVAAKWFNINIPMKKLESRAAHREYFQSRDFIFLLKTKFNALFYGTLNKHNKMTDLVQQMQQHHANTGVQFQRFFIGWGNNFEIVKQVLKTRTWWQQCNNEEFSEVAFMWTSWKKQQHIDYLSGGSYFQTAVGGHLLNQSASFVTDDDCKAALTNMQKSSNNNQKCLKNSIENDCFKMYNRMEQNKQLTNKKGVFLNMRDYYYTSGQDPFDVLPLTFLIKPSKNGEQDFQRFQTYYNDIQNQARDNRLNCQIAIEQRVREIRQECIQRRKREERERQMAMIFKKQLTQKAPIVLPGKKPKLPRSGSKIQCYDDSESVEQSEYDEDQKKYEEEQRLIDNDQKIKDIKLLYPEIRNIWIVKPGENTNRGNGIEVCSELSHIKRLVSNAKDGANGQDSTFIIQRYIDNPLLIHARKFDFRCYGVLTSVNGLLKGYFYEDAYIRTSCKEFDIEDVHNKYIHLTNDAVQKFSQDYGKYENGNKLSLSDFQRYLKTHHPELNVDVFRHIMPQIRKLVTDSYRSVYGKIDPMRLNNTFELFGYDFMLDADFRLYLIEVNTNPCLETSCPLLARIIPDVLDNTFRLVLDPIYPSPEGFNPRKTQQAPQEIKFTLVFDEEVDGPQLLKMRQAEANGNTDEIESDNEDEQEDQQPKILIENQKLAAGKATGPEKQCSQSTSEGGQ